MRKCLRCGAEMEEGFVITSGYGIVIRPTGERKKSAKAVKPAVAVCPRCGEVSIYVDNNSKEAE